MDFDYIKEYLSNFDLVKANAIEVTKDCFKFDGTLNRTKYFTYSVFLCIVGMIVGLIATLVGFIPIVGWIIALVAYLAMLPLIAMAIGPMVRRIRDTGKDLLVPILCLFPGIILCGLPTIYTVIVLFSRSANEEAPATVAAQPAAEHPQDQPPAQN